MIFLPVQNFSRLICKNKLLSLYFPIRTENGAAPLFAHRHTVF